MDERHLFIGDRRQVELGLLVVTQFNCDRLPILRLENFFDDGFLLRSV